MFCRRFDFGLFGFLLAAALFIAMMSPQVRAATADDFKVRTTADYIALCSTTPDQDNYVAAVHFCEGFASGAYQYYMSFAERSPDERFVCLPDPPPTRDAAMAAFVAWVKANPSAAEDRPVDSIFHYLGETYPCATR
jgi:Rap1a immunity proteins